jgi:hypothetical protein
MVPKKNPRFAKINEMDYNGNGIEDTIVTKKGKYFLLTVFFQKLLIFHYHENY